MIVVEICDSRGHPPTRLRGITEERRTQSQKEREDTNGTLGDQLRLPRSIPARARDLARARVALYL
eukprot:2006916-Rhodomonas_salina.2